MTLTAPAIFRVQTPESIQPFSGDLTTRNSPIMTANNILVNDVPMQGKGFYSSHSELQHAAMLEALPLLRRATAEITVDPSQLGYLTVAEYGSAHGNNS